MDGNASKHRPRKLVLCFDGTGNKFKGDDSDSNILKIFRMLDRNSSDQCKSIPQQQRHMQFQFAHTINQIITTSVSKESFKIAICSIACTPTWPRIQKNN